MTSPNSSMTVTAVPASGTNAIDALAAGAKWGNAGPGATIAYSFPYASGPTAAWATDYSNEHEPDTASGFLPAHQAAARQALQTWADVANLNLIEIAETATNVGDIRFAYTGTPAIAPWWGWSGQPAAHWPAGGDIWVNAQRAADDWLSGSSHFSALLHEIGHALGLKHPFEGTPVLPAAEDSWQYSLMSYTEPPHALFRDVVDLGGGSYSWTYYSVTPTTPMLYDIAAIQHLYGANMSYHTGDDTYAFGPDSPFLMTLWDAGGNDTISVANFTKGCTLDLRAGHFSKVSIESDPLPAGATGTTPTYDGTDNLAIAFGVTIENAIGGSGNDSLVGNDGNSALAGGAGGDTLVGGDGNDSLAGGDGNDILVFDSSDGAVDGGAGTDTGIFLDLESYLALAFPMAAHSIEELQWTKYGNTYRLALNGDGSKTESVTDTAGSETTFASRTTRIDASGALDWIDTTADNGLRTFNDVDNLANQPWVQLFQVYDGYGQIDFRDYRNDDGSRLIIDDDNLNNQGWTQLQQKYDAQGREDYRDYRLDDGKRQLDDYDQANNQSFVQVNQIFDAQGREDYRDYRLDDGKRQLVDYDQASNQSWGEVIQLYDAQGREDYRDYRFDDATRQLVDYDEASNQGWSRSTQFYDTLGRQDYRDYAIDDGSRTFIDYDQAGQFAWAEWQKEFNAGGTLVHQHVVYDSGAVLDL